MNATVRTVRCPRCGAPARYAADNPWRPFCSERCRSHDLGAWASERFRIEGAQPDPHDGAAPGPAPPDD